MEQPTGTILDEPLSPPNTTNRHRCYICSRTYERADHLSRHLRSHENERTYRCPDCGKGFNRADLLNRHHAAHTKGVGDASRRRTGRACAVCIKAKTRCDEQRPCKRCKTREVPCEESEARILSSSQPIEPIERRASPDGEISSGAAESTRPDQFTDQHMQSGYIHPEVWVPGALPENPVQQPTPSPSSRHFEDASLLLGLNTSGTVAPLAIPFNGLEGHYQPPGLNTVGTVFPDFFEQIMMPSIDVPHHALIQPPDVSNFTSDFTFDAGDFDFSFLASGLTRPSTAQGYRLEADHEGPEAASASHSDVHLRSEAFKRAPWSWQHWIPEKASSTFSGQDTIDVARIDRVDASDQLLSPHSVRLVQADLGHSERDRMIRLVTQVSHTRLAIPSFPSLELLEDLCNIFLLQDSSAIDSYIHSATFDCKKARTELLLAIVAAGARYIALAPVWKMGLVIQEVARVAIGELLESDNTTTRELSPLQVILLVLDIGIWSGVRRKTEISIAFLQPPVTMLCWSQSLRKFSYHDFVPSEDDTDEVLEEKWHAWVDREAKKRLILHTFLHDSQVAILYTNSNPLLSPSQLMMPLPACRELWLAPNAYVWRNTYLRLNPPSQAETPSMLEFFGNTALLEKYGGVVDKTLCMLTSCHGLGHEVWQYRNHARLLAGWRNTGRRDRSLEHQRLQRDLLDDLTTLYAHCEMQTNSAPEVMMTLEMLIMMLHVDIEDIQTFSGKIGEDEARRIFPCVSTWSQNAESRVAVYHAGQVFRWARSFEKTKLRDFFAVALYHSVLTLWVYGMVTSNAARLSGTQTPGQSLRQPAATPSAASATPSRSVVLDATDERGSRAFQLLGQGAPGISDLRSNFVPLASPSALMSTAAAILRANFPQSLNGLPPLVDNLANLMDELGRLSGREQDGLAPGYIAT